MGNKQTLAIDDMVCILSPSIITFCGEKVQQRWKLLAVKKEWMTAGDDDKMTMDDMDVGCRVSRTGTQYPVQYCTRVGSGGTGLAGKDIDDFRLAARSSGRISRAKTSLHRNRW
jgi:hypothetical protein